MKILTVDNAVMNYTVPDEIEDLGIVSYTSDPKDYYFCPLFREFPCICNMFEYW